MSGRTTKDGLVSAAYEFKKTFEAFQKAAGNLMAIMDDMRRKGGRELKDVPEGSEQTHKFLIQMMDDSGKVMENCFGIEYVAEDGKMEEQKLSSKAGKGAENEFSEMPRDYSSWTRRDLCLSALHTTPDHPQAVQDYLL